MRYWLWCPRIATFKVHFSYALYCEAECFGVTLVYLSLSLSLSLFVDNSERKTCPPSGFERRSNDFRGDPGALLSTKRFLADRQVPDSRKSVTSWHIRKSWRGTDRLELFLTATWTILGIKITLIYSIVNIIVDSIKINKVLWFFCNFTKFKENLGTCNSCSVLCVCKWFRMINPLSIGTIKNLEV